MNFLQQFDTNKSKAVDVEIQDWCFSDEAVFQHGKEMAQGSFRLPAGELQQLSSAMHRAPNILSELALVYTVQSTVHKQL